MSWIADLIELVYPSIYNRARIDAIPSAPTPPFPFVFSLFDYHTSAGKKLVYFIKKYNDTNLSNILAEKISEYLSEYLSEQQQFAYFNNPLVVVVPLTPHSLKKRGFNQNVKIAQELAQLVSGTFLPSLIVKTKETQKQALLKHRSDRTKNIHNAFAVPDDKKSLVSFRDVIIVDDLVTTGATLLEMKRVLEKAGARKVIAITVAH